MTGDPRLRHPSAGCQQTATGVRCLHGCNVTFLTVDAWLAHLPLIHGHRHLTPFSTPTEPESLPVSTPPAPVVMSGQPGGTFPGGAA